MSEGSEVKVLFEMTISEDGTRIEIYESPEWQDYHAQRPPFRREPGPLPPFIAWFQARREQSARSRKENLRRALDSLQDIYDDLYGKAAGSES
jgi:hypothetical protein